jgi:hypothetical protein
VVEYYGAHSVSFPNYIFWPLQKKPLVMSKPAGQFSSFTKWSHTIWVLFVWILLFNTKFVQFSFPEVVIKVILVCEFPHILCRDLAQFIYLFCFSWTVSSRGLLQNAAMKIRVYACWVMSANNSNTYNYLHAIYLYTRKTQFIYKKQRGKWRRTHEN